MLTIKFLSSARNIELMRAKGPKIVQVLFSKVSMLTQMLASYVQQNKLSGQSLTPRSGNLRASVHAVPTEMQGTKIVGAVEAAGGTAFYGKFFEEGGKGAFRIAAKNKRSLMWEAGGSKHFAFAVIHPKIRQLPFMQPSLDENEANIRAELNAAVNQVISEE
ncbi:MAG: hypothetical protein ABR973_06195 [Candidatus Acidiferrales bacterium]|jgi:hypothetical protein